jgi:hypothetical protein
MAGRTEFESARTLQWRYLFTTAILMTISSSVLAQGAGIASKQGLPTAQQMEADAPLAPFPLSANGSSGRQMERKHLTGWWVSYVTEDWALRMVTPPKGDVVGIPLNAQGIAAANAWDWQTDDQQHTQCKAFGAAALTHVPTRLHIEWQDDNTLKMQSDAGEQTRLLRFGGDQYQQDQPLTWQGVSVATWESTQLQASGLEIVTIPPTPPSYSLRVQTTGMRAGYLRANGVPYSEQTVLVEYFDTVTTPNGQEWLLATSIVDDPVYLQQPYVTTYAFKREPDGSRWHPTPCYIDKPARGPQPVGPQAGLGRRPIHWPTYPEK